MLPILTPKGLSYIERSFSLLEEEPKQPRLHIDGGIGDYRMRLFRLKDRNSYRNANHSVFTTTFTNQLLPHSDPELRHAIRSILTHPASPQPATAPDHTPSTRNQQIATHKKGSFAETIEEEEHLIYPYISDHQRRKWFSTLNNSDRGTPKQQPPDKPELVPLQRKATLKPTKNKYIFAYMDLLDKQRDQQL